MNTLTAVARILGFAGIIAAAASLISVPVGARQAKPASQLVGTWFNQDPETLGITQVVLFNQGGKLLVHAWGACMPTDCDQGQAEVTLADGVASATFDVGFAKDHMSLLRQPTGKLVVIDKPEYLDHPEIKSKEEAYHLWLR
jgi:hypothetical protein